MDRRLAVLACLTLCRCSDDAGPAATDATGSTTATGSSESTGGYPLDDELRLNHIQAEGSHNSYHLAPPAPILELDYTHDPLDVQLEVEGVRHFELDVHWSTDEGFRVFHIPTIDEGTTCDRFVDCLDTIHTWSTEHPDHHLLFVLIEPKDDLDSEKIVGHYDDLENDILSVWTAESVLMPDEVRGRHATLREAVVADGWPTLGQTRGRIAFVLWDQGMHRDEYAAESPNLAGQLMFVASDPERDDAAVVKMDDPADGEAIAQAVRDGFIVRSRADAGVAEAAANDMARFQAALDAGAHLISTDFPAPVDGFDYWIELPGGTPSRCNPISAPDACRSEAIESL